MTERDSDSISQEIRIAAHPETVFAFLTDPEKLVRWKGRHATIDARPGGLYRVDIDGRHIARGAYVEVVANRRVVFTWGWEDEGNPVPPGSSTVEITLRPDGDGTILRLVHRGLPGPARRPHAQGWAHYLDRLVVAASGRDPGRDAWEDPQHGPGLCE
jgi:uncharacterized protein YndB with AHSA1/START domain